MPRFMPTFGLVCLGFIVAVSSSFVHADNWERFRGPNGTGTSNDKNIPTQFSAKEALWTTAIPGIGHSSPVVWGNRLFLHSSSSNGTQRWLLCYDTADGKELWKRGIPALDPKAHIYAVLNSWASSTPATDGDAVYVPFWDGKNAILTAYDFKGESLWNQNLGPFISQHGPGASPIVYKDKVIFASDMDREDPKSKTPTSNPARLYAFNKKTGAIVWEMPREGFRACYSVPSILEKQGAPPELIVTSTTAITSYDPEDGRENWSWRWTFTAKLPLRTIASTIVHDGLLFANSGDGGGDRHAVAVALNGSGKEARPDKLWENKKEFPYVTSLLSRGDYLYFTNDNGFAGCYHAKTGKRVWYERITNSKFYSSPLLIDGKIYACTEAGDVLVFPAEPEFHSPIKNSLGEPIRATPAVAGGRLYVRSHEHLFCIGK